MQHRRRVLVETPKGRISAGFSVPATAAATDVSMRLREGGVQGKFGPPPRIQAPLRSGNRHRRVQT